MKRAFVCVILLGVLAGDGRAGVILGSSNPFGSPFPLTVTAGTTSGPMLINVVSNNPPNDVMAAWQFRLMVVPVAGATGALTFKDPAMNSMPANPTNYIFDTHGTGIAVPTGGGTLLDANDFDVNLGTPVPGSPGANLLQVDFAASASASGLFAIAAVEGPQFTLWTDAGGTSQSFINVPNGVPITLIGAVRVTPAIGPTIPEPSTLALFALAGAALAGWRWRRRGP
jgi:hypothetical protein